MLLENRVIGGLPVLHTMGSNISKELNTSQSPISFSTVNSRFKKDLKLQIHLHKTFFSDNRFLDSLHKSFLNQTSLDLKERKNGLS